ncbi:MarR family transcriptional regulator [Rhizobiaceae bacterium BDR2-2]|uniref:MarR family transcriptional regulator n=1 Tax=Ectorhizobium quercum TaxID=2965071 RepID=A0AAE3N2A7_9HYPH|nr:MarR family transcriptional regulator [Ectorhizobium quercum]MCX8997980.1 MarR family transcriptional regulator [Ectorhizobium quercum]
MNGEEMAATEERITISNRNEKAAAGGSSADDYHVEQQIGFVLRQANQRHVSLFTSMIGDRLTTTQWAALTKLRELQPTSQNFLGRETAMDVATIKGVVDRLVSRGLIHTAPDPKDGRRLVLSLTEEGNAVIDRNMDMAIAVSEETLAPLTSRERAVLAELLRRIC